jgi:hypothetical protein
MLDLSLRGHGLRITKLGDRILFATSNYPFEKYLRGNEQRGLDFYLPSL